ncbi:hypothetical protein AB0G81_21030, partial [Streptomyces asoensis]
MLWRPSGYDGVVNDYVLVRSAGFLPRGGLSDEELAAENITGHAGDVVVALHGGQRAVLAEAADGRQQT